jgi:dTDP-4-dehydrorhamnose reductase
VNPGFISLVVGGDGRLGRGLAEHLRRQGGAVLLTTRRRKETSGTRLYLDLSEDVSRWELPRPVDVAYLCAAVASLEACRKDPGPSRHVNVEQTAALARALAAAGAFVVLPSSTFVFDGRRPFPRPDDPVRPETEYGRQKAEAERRVLELGSRGAVVRITKVVVPEAPPFGDWVRALRAGEVIRPFADKVLSPVSLPYAAEALLRVGARRLAGVSHVSGTADITYEQAARHLARRLGTRPAQVVAGASAHSGLGPGAAPGHTALDASRVRAELGLEPADPWQTLDEVFAG